MREYKEVCLQLLRNIATSETFEEYTIAVNKLKEHEVWSFPKPSGISRLGRQNMVTTLSSMLTACQPNKACASNAHHF